MAYTDLDRRRDGIIGGSNVTGSFDQTAVPYIFKGAGSTETRVQFPFTAEWFQITATTGDAVRYAFNNDGTDTNGGAVVAGNTSSPVFHAPVDELYVINDYVIVAKLSSIPSGSNSYSIDER